MRRLITGLAAVPFLVLTVLPASAQSGSKPVPVATLVKKVDIPYEAFTLANGLRVFVHTDRKAPIVAVSVWYDVGSKHEPKGKTGFAHLFEHLMFNGSENAPGDFFEPLQQVGATDFNGTTWFDRTNYFETVPTPALERALFLESDRMGHLLGAVTQDKLDNQRGVVQNEKRQGDNQPYGLVEYAQIAALFSPDHPYGHSTIGSMADLDAASLEDVKNWFRSHYGPNNAIIVLAGDIDAKTARPLMEKYFGDIARGPQTAPVNAPVPTLAARKDEVMKDRVAQTRIYRTWIVPGLNDKDTVPLAVGATVLGGLSSSRLDNILVRQEKSAVRVSANLQEFANISQFEVQVDVKPGVDAEAVSKRLDTIISDFVKAGPTADEVERVATRVVAGRIAGLESVGGFGGKAVALAEGALYSNDPQFYKKQLAAYAKVTPAEVRAAMGKWLSRPVYALTVIPGERAAYDEAKGAPSGGATFAPSYYRAPSAVEKPMAAPSKIAPEDASASGAAPLTAVDRSKLPEVGPIADLDFPQVTRAKLSNGVELIYANRAAVPITQIALSFDAGNAADPKAKLGTQSLMLALLEEGTTSLNSVQIAERQERLGAGINAGSSMDRTTVSLFALSDNLAPSLDLFADVVQHPAFDPSEVERLRGQQLARIAQEMTQPQSIALRQLPPLLFGKAHPYGVPATGTGDPAAVAQVTRDDLLAFHRAWFRPEKAKIFVVSDQPLAKIQSLLEARFGKWASDGAAGAKNFDAAIPAAKPRIVLIDRKDSPQSLILAGEILPLKGNAEITDLLAANDVLGGSFLSRINMDLRETKGWSYGVGAQISRFANDMPYMIFAPVQADKTGLAIAALREQYQAFLGPKGVTAEELERTKNGSIRELPGSYETAADVLGGMQRNDLFQRSDDYYDTLADRYRALTAADLDKAARGAIKPDQLTWIVVGDAAKVKPQLDTLGLPVEVVAAQ
ncbi:M16 family metallopeptidase [Sphingomonas colocasiae]|uniref:Insulinase family protein n=1 Tax=Sphingomonas colocasiae TaxID=1848973 RepID=A0ABS7PM69_9SPHN|nr:pitrilysin family protein [Sphingomonas colocasiae]MBY8822417.1 insulinase family protein [Sphingomonas colocasiae]